MLQKLPAVSGRQPVAYPWFPSTLHAVVWRNWELIPVERTAAALGASPQKIITLGHSMGLSGPPRITDQTLRRSYITTIRRNWHLLPYDQLLQLLNWKEEELAFTLREDDFLYVKLGLLKPNCPAVRWHEPTEAERRRAEEMAHLVRSRFGSRVGTEGTPPFAFLQDLRRHPTHRAHDSRPDAFSPRYCYSYFAVYGDPLLEPKDDPYPDGYLAQLRDAGVDGVWLQGLLMRLGPFPWKPSLSAGYERRLQGLRRLTERAARFGIGVHLYLNEPRAMPLDLFREFPHLKGVQEGDHATLCTSVPEVRRYLVDWTARICEAAPKLASIFTITASENLTNCWSHGQGAACPRCRERGAAEVIADVNRALAEGIAKTRAQTQLTAWDWGWADAWAEKAVDLLPKGCRLQSVSEWSLTIDRGGVKSEIGEYSLSSPGPGPRALRQWAAAKRRGLKANAKIQAGNCWELSAVPYVPVPPLAAQHAENLRGRADGIMLGWTLGGYPSPNLEAVREVGRGASATEACRTVALRRFEADADAVLKAWYTAAEAYRQFPFHGGTVYSAPLQVGPANPLWMHPTGYAATMVGIPYDDVNAWRSIYPADIFAALLRRVAAGFSEACAALRRGTSGRAAGAEADLMEACALHFGSVADQTEFNISRANLRGEKLQEILSREMERAHRLYQLRMQDSRLGFEASNHYYFTPLDLVEKAVCCSFLKG
jgi:hypothetical protein